MLSNEELSSSGTPESRNRSGLLAFSRRKDGKCKDLQYDFWRYNEERKSELIKSFESNLFLVPKRIGLYLARVAPQECIDRLVRAVSFRALEPESEIYSNADDLYHSYIEEPDLAIILLAEIATEHDEYFRSQLIVLVHAVVATLATSRNALLCAYCQMLLANLLHKLAEQPLVRRVGKYENDDEILLKTPIGGPDRRALLIIRKRENSSQVEDLRPGVI